MAWDCSAVDNETLEKFCRNELTAEIRAELMDHLLACDACHERFMLIYRRVHPDVK